MPQKLRKTQMPRDGAVAGVVGVSLVDLELVEGKALREGHASR